MVTQYPYTLEEYQVADATLGTTGNWETPEGEWVEISKCRDESGLKGGGSSLLYMPDGKAITFSSLIQLPMTCPILKGGATIRVMDGDILRLEGKILRFVQDQLHSRAWV